MTGISWRGMAASVVIGGSLWMGAITSVVAQDASPAAGTATGVMCTAEPRPVNELVALWFGPTGTPLATPTGQPPVQSTAELPQGKPADEQTVAAVTATIAEVFACFDAGQYARAFTLTTDRATSQFGPDVSDPDENTPDKVTALLEAQIAGTPTAPPAGQQTAISEAREARVLDDGRVGAIFEIEGGPVFALFEQRGDLWLLDDFIFIIASGATPTS